MIDARFADMPFIRCEQEISYYYRLLEAIDARMEVEDGDPLMQCWFFDKLYTSHYLMHGGSHRTQMLEFEAR